MLCSIKPIRVGERSVRIREVVGSNPISSTILKRVSVFAGTCYLYISISVMSGKIIEFLL